VEAFAGEGKHVLHDAEPGNFGRNIAVFFLKKKIREIFRKISFEKAVVCGFFFAAFRFLRGRFPDDFRVKIRSNADGEK
jgi:hypothetical protein